VGPDLDEIGVDTDTFYFPGTFVSRSKVQCEVPSPSTFDAGSSHATQKPVREMTLAVCVAVNGVDFACGSSEYDGPAATVRLIGSVHIAEVSPVRVLAGRAAKLTLLAEDVPMLPGLECIVTLSGVRIAVPARIQGV